MKKFLLIFILFIIHFSGFSQKLNGQWRGYFNSDGDIGLTNGTTEYVLELEINGTKVTGSSYTYFENRTYYVICSLDGIYDKKTKRIVVNEVTRVKGSTRVGWSDCLQTHILFYENADGKEILQGSWKTSPYQTKANGGCGAGITTLSRRIITNMPFAFNMPKNVLPEKKPDPPYKKSDKFKDLNKPENTTPPVVKAKPKLNAAPIIKPKPNVVIAKPTIKQKDSIAIIKPDVKRKPPTTELPIIVNTEKPKVKISENSFYEKRNNTILKTIEITNETFKVDFYDNGEIDGDSISVFYNGKLLLSHKRLSDKAISLTLEPAKNNETNEITMYAENLGTIPPNTALMVVTDGDKRYEVSVTSDLQKSGTIKFIHKAKGT